MQHGLDTTRFSFHTHANLCARKIDIKPTMQSSRIHTRCVHDSLQMHVCTSEMHTPNLDYTCMQILS